MEFIYEKLMYGALLHDIGKLIQRASPGEGNHGNRGAEFVADVFIGKQWREVMDCIRYHHADTLKNVNLPNDSLAYIVYEADNVAAGADRRKREANQGQGIFRRDIPLYNIFNIFKHDESTHETAFYLKTLEESVHINFPEEVKNVDISPLKYSYLLSAFEKGFKKMSVGSDSIESLLKLLEVCLAFVPSSTNTQEVPDISLFNHSKLTAMVAGCLYYYLAEQGKTNYRELCFEQPEKLRNEKTMLLVSGDMSGIQNFIYTISSKGALKSLRGRSFYLEIFLEHLIDEILTSCKVCRANLLYSGGGHFYLILPNTRLVRGVLEKAREDINSWLLGMYSTELYLEISATEASAYELANGFERKEKTDNLLGSLFQKVSRSNALGKMQRYSLKQLEQMTDPDSLLNTQLDAGRECAVCGSSRHMLTDKDGILMCENCLGLFMAGDKLARMTGSEEKRPVLVIKKEAPLGEVLPLPSLELGQVYLSFADMKEARELLKQGHALRVYSINSFLTGENYMTNLWVGTYNAAGEGKGLIDFATLARRSCGIKRIGVLRADVDDLGQAFIRGFTLPKGEADRFRYVSLSRNAALSYHLSIFFKHEINKLCKGKMGNLSPFQLPGKNKEPVPEKNVVIVYAGGDDVFIVGAWDEVLELAVDLHRAFKKFTGSKMTLSAGVGIYHDSFPINRMAELTGDLEKAAKTGTKNQISLFGPEIGEKRGKNAGFIFKHVYQWDDFIDKVCGEKLAGLLKWFSIDEGKQETGKLQCGMSRLYKFLQLFRGIEEQWNNGGRIELARLAYILGRMEPSEKEKESLGSVYREMKNTIYRWAMSERERQELITALTILIYLKRKGEDEHE